LAAPADSPAATADSPADAQLLIQNVRVAPASDSARLVAKFDVAWSSTVFPGFRECTFRALNAKGVEVGRFTDLIAALSPTEDLSVSVPVSRAAVSVGATCGPRLDIGNPYAYQFTTPTVETETDSLTGAEDIAVTTFDATWQGEGLPGAVDCTFTYLDSSGATVVQDRATFYALTGSVTRAEHRFQSPAFTEAPPASVLVECAPFAGDGGPTP